MYIDFALGYDLIDQGDPSLQERRAKMAAALQERLQIASAEFQKIQAELATVVEARQKLDAQLSENELVKKVRPSLSSCHLRDPARLMYHNRDQEFASLTEDNTVYKLVGPVLVKQDQAEAKQNVDTRLEFIKSEMCVRPFTQGPLRWY